MLNLQKTRFSNCATKKRRKECAAPEDTEVWSSLSPNNAKPKCEDVTESMMQNGVVLDALIWN